MKTPEKLLCFNNEMWLNEDFCQHAFGRKYTKSLKRNDLMQPQSVTFTQLWMYILKKR
jgi:hypothetical protein